MDWSSSSTRFKAFWEAISASYWFIPVCMMVASTVLCLFCLNIAQRDELPEYLFEFIPLITQTGAQQLLATIATAIITATSVAFSMTVVALVMASSQFGPRLLRTFMLDRATQFVLGTLVSTFLFCLISLHHLSNITEDQDAISLIAAVSGILATVSVFTIIFFIHHLARSIQADEVIYRCFENFTSNLGTLLPKPEETPDQIPINAQLPREGDYQITLLATANNYIQTINYDGLLKRDNDRIAGIELLARSGDYVFAGEPLLIVHSSCELNDAIIEQLKKFIVTGDQRTPVQDPEFAISQLVEIALRALSPSINDPYTAISCLNRLTSACILMSNREFPAHTLVNKQTNVWMKRRTFSLEGVINTAFDQIRQTSKEHVSVVLHVLRCLQKLDQMLPGSYRELLCAHAQATYSLAISCGPTAKDSYSLKEQSAYFGLSTPERT